MSKKIIIPCFLLMTSPLWAQTNEPMETSSGATEGRVVDEGQVQVPREGQVENAPEGQVEAINPVAEQPRSQVAEPDLFRFESRLFNPIPSEE